MDCNSEHPIPLEKSLHTRRHLTREIMTLGQPFAASGLEMACRRAPPFQLLRCLGVPSPRERVSTFSSL